MYGRKLLGYDVAYFKYCAPKVEGTAFCDCGHMLQYDDYTVPESVE